MKSRWSKLFALLSFLFLGATIAVTEDFSFLPDGWQQQDFATMAGPTGKQYAFCWVVKPCTDCVQPYNIQFRKYRVEGGQEYMSKLLHVSEWVLRSTLPDGGKEYCTNDSVPMTGHWVYEARVCGPPPAPTEAPVCTLASSIDPTYATVVAADGSRAPRAWWIYTFLAPPGAPEVDMKWWNSPSPEMEKGVVPVLQKPKEVLANVEDY